MTAIAFASTYTVKTSGGDYNSIVTCLNSISGGDVCEVYSGSYSGGTVTNSGSGLGAYIKTVPAPGQSVTITSGFSFGTNDYIQIGEYVNETRNGFTINSSSLSCSPGGSFITIAGNTFYNQGSIGGSMICHDVLFDGNRMYSESTGDFFSSPKYNGRTEVYRIVLRNNNAGPRLSDGGSHHDFLQIQCWDEHNDDIDYGWYVLEGNVHHDVSGSNQHYFISNCVNGVDCRGIIIRYNSMSSVSSTFMDTNQSDGATKSDYVCYNNTLFQNGSTNYNWSYGANVGGTMLMANNLIYNSTSTSPSGSAGGSGYSLDGDCPNNLVYTNGSSISFSGCMGSSSGNLGNKNPLFSDPAPGTSLDFSISEGSPAIDKGRHLTLANGSGSSSTSLTVDDPIMFQDGWAGVDPDCIAVGTVTNTACIVRNSINYDTGAMTLDTSLSWSDNANVWLYKKSDGAIVLIGSAPDIGAYEYDSGTTPPAAPGRPRIIIIQ